MTRNLFARIVLFGALCITYASAAGAQAVYGSLVGNVTDSSGGAIPGATVTVTQTQTNLTREAVTNADGTIRALNGVGGISSTDRTGRQYDEREWRVGARFGF